MSTVKSLEEPPSCNWAKARRYQREGAPQRVPTRSTDGGDASSGTVDSSMTTALLANGCASKLDRQLSTHDEEAPRENSASVGSELDHLAEHLMEGSKALLSAASTLPGLNRESMSMFGGKSEKTPSSKTPKPKQKKYAAFLSHYKVEAGSDAVRARSLHAAPPGCPERHG